MPTSPPLRSLPADAAVRLAQREAGRLGMRLETRLTGQEQHPVVVSLLMRGGIQVAAGGSGKGSGSAAVAGAHFEALERYYMSARINRRLASGAADVKSARDVARQPALAGDLVIQRWADDYPDSVAACATYGNETSSVWYPIFLTDPYYHRQRLPGDSVGPYRSMLRYASSLGTAAGSNAQESRLHGLCELLEHDALSHALLRWAVTRKPAASVLDITSVPDDGRLLYRVACDAVGADVFLLDITTDIGVPAYLAVKGGRDAEAELFGLGASPIGANAASRALGELIQVAAATGASMTRTASTHMKAWPALHRCLTVPLESLAGRDPGPVPLRGTSGNADTVQSALDTVTGMLREHGIPCYTCELAPPGSLISVTSTIAPGLERFSLIRFGHPIAPTGRGRDIWMSASQAGPADATPRADGD
jgi:ribosomal protein S12 methylthiotransferase accessory factor